MAATPLYVKSHSWGEYVFDHGWADAYRRAGGRYYPKLQAAVPFTPVPGRRLLACDDSARAALVAALPATLEQLPVSSLHLTFCTAEEALLLEEAGFLIRRGVQYHWQNQGYADFAGFLDSLRSAKKKMVRKEREQVRASGIELRVLDGSALTGQILESFYPFYLATVDKRWGSAYLTEDFFRRLGTTLRDRVVLVGRLEGRPPRRRRPQPARLGCPLRPPVGLPGGVPLPPLRVLLLSGDRLRDRARHPPRRGRCPRHPQAPPRLRPDLDLERPPDPRPGAPRRHRPLPRPGDPRAGGADARAGGAAALPAGVRALKARVRSHPA